MKEVLKYQDEIQKSKETLESEELQYRVEQAELNVRGVISETKKELTKAKKKLNELIRKDPFDYVAYLESEEDVEQLEKGLAKAEQFLKERF